MIIRHSKDKKLFHFPNNSFGIIGKYFKHKPITIMNELLEFKEDEPILRMRKQLEDLSNKGLKKSKIWDFLNIPETQKSSLYKFADGDPFPIKLRFRIDEFLEKLDKLLENPKLIDEQKESLVEDENPGYESGNSLLVLNYLDFEMIQVNYDGDQRPGSLDKKDDKWGLVAFRTKYANADGEFNLQFEGLRSEIKPGSLIVIKKINKQDFIPGHIYLVIDASLQIFARKLFKSNGEVRLVCDDEKNYPEFTLSLDNIIALFSIKKQIKDLL